MRRRLRGAGGNSLSGGCAIAFLRYQCYAFEERGWQCLERKICQQNLVYSGSEWAFRERRHRQQSATKWRRRASAGFPVSTLVSIVSSC